MQERCRLISESQWREYLECVQKIHKLEERLEVAISALEEYANKAWWEDCRTDDDPGNIHVKCAWCTNGYESAQKALKKMEEQ